MHGIFETYGHAVRKITYTTTWYKRDEKVECTTEVRCKIPKYVHAIIGTNIQSPEYTFPDADVPMKASEVDMYNLRENTAYLHPTNN